MGDKRQYFLVLSALKWVFKLERKLFLYLPRKILKQIFSRFFHLYLVFGRNRYIEKWITFECTLWIDICSHLRFFSRRVTDLSELEESDKLWLTAFVCVTAIIVLVGFFLVLLAWAKQWSIAAAERERVANEAKQVKSGVLKLFWLATP